MTAWTFTLLVVGAALVAWAWWSSRGRVAAIRQLAARHQFAYLGEALPRSLPLTDLSLPTISSLWNVIDGECRGRRVVAFDCRFGTGKGSWRRTVLAVHDSAINITATTFDPSVQVEQVLGWTFLYRPKQLALIAPQLTPVAELEAYIEAI